VGDTFIKVVVERGSQVTHNISAAGATTLAWSDAAVMVRYFSAGQFDVSVTLTQCCCQTL